MENLQCSGQSLKINSCPESHITFKYYTRCFVKHLVSEKLIHDFQNLEPKPIFMRKH